VAVKVRHPGVEEKIRLDFTIMHHCARAAEQLLGLTWLHLSESLAQFSHTIAAQTRLHTEGRHLDLFNRHFASWDDVSFPQPLLLTDGVLVESWEWGQTMGGFVDNYSLNLRRQQQQPLHPLLHAPFSTATSTSTSRPSSRDELCFWEPGPGAPHLEDLRTAHLLVTRGEDVYLKMLLQASN
jgi:hypothetical protein